MGEGVTVKLSVGEDAPYPLLAPSRGAAHKKLHERYIPRGVVGRGTAARG